LPTDSLLVDLRIPFTRPGEFVQTHRVARRPQMAHPIVNAGFRCRIEGGRVAEAVVVYGGLGSCNGRLPATEKALLGKPWDGATLKAVLAVLDKEVAAFPQDTDGEGFTGAYRSQLARSFFYKFFLHVSERLSPGSVTPANRSAADHGDRPVSHGTHQFTASDTAAPLTRPTSRGRSSSACTATTRCSSTKP
jgi:xanthine dehydrogenase/oxidase